MIILIILVEINEGGGIIGMGAKSQNKYILSRRKRGEVIEEAIDYFVVKSVIFTNNTAIFSI